MEAEYELNHSLDAKSKGYWEAIRRRAGMDTDYEKTNRNTDLTKEIDLARYSGNNLVDVTLYNIRRERRVERWLPKDSACVTSAAGVHSTRCRTIR